jgi:multicomponent Na+:H+ antiporter subunit D
LALLLLLNLLYSDAVRKVALPLTALLALAQSALVVFRTDLLQGNPDWLRGLLALNLAADSLSFVLLLATGLVVFTVALAVSTLVTDGRKQFNFLSVLLIALTGMNGIVLLQDIFSLYVFMEIISVASFILIAFNRDKGGLEGAFKYLILSAVASVLMIAGIALMMMLAGGTQFGMVHDALVKDSAFGLSRIAMASFLIGLFIKSGLVPFHGWVPAAYSAAPAAGSIFLAGIATKVGGVYALIRLATDVLPASAAVNQTLMLVGAASIVVGALAAIGQKDMKRMLAYSSISQVGYIILGLGVGLATLKLSPLGAKPGAMNWTFGAMSLGLVGAIFHLFNHAIFKSLLFVNAAAVEQQVGTTQMSKMGGLSPRMPVTNATNVLAILSTAGIPPLSGFWSKLIIIIALWQAGQFAYAFVAIGFSVVTLAYLLLIQRRVFFGVLPDELANVKEAGGGLVIGSILLAGITLGLGLLAPFVLSSLQIQWK